MAPAVGPGASFPLGATVLPDGVNFAVYSRSAEGVELLLFDSVEAAAPSMTIPLDRRVNRTPPYWHAFVRGLGAGQVYGYRVRGPHDPGRGLRHDPRKLLLDPYGVCVGIPRAYRRAAACGTGENVGAACKSAIADPAAYDWEEDRPPRRPWSRTVIYEMHVGGFTRHPNSGVAPGRRGTYAGLIEKIPYLQELGITAVELLPVYQFDPEDAPPGKVNYWGYAPVSFFAPHRAYSARQDLLGPLDEFRDMVKALHRAGIEIILDVVYNHTAEGNEGGPTFCFRGFDNEAYYILEPDRSRYANFSGTGNCLKANHPVVHRLILDSLRYWVRHMHVDGFRFDLASILARDEQGHPLPNPPVLSDIDTDPVLAGSKIIAEAWDAGGLYQVGSFIGDNWMEWNGRFRDDIRSFVKSDPGTVSGVASRILGSPDIYAREEREPEQSINFVTCHDGFTLNDLVSYNEKHNAANGEDNRDGANDNRSWNCGVEGPTDDAGVEELRNRQVKNFLTLTLLAVGTPMILMGDEVRRSQRGNNNAYCQDNETSWFDWSLRDRHADVLRFARTLIASRLAGTASDDRDVTLNEHLQRASIAWHGPRLGQPDWSDQSRSLACTIGRPDGSTRLHLILNAFWTPVDFDLPPAGPGWGAWRRWIDTALPPPDDICPDAEAAVVTSPRYTARDRSVVVLTSRAGGA